ncbi:Clavaminate synthase-like protein [Pseudovirgaria hyperparasitica]|uniref:Clavaminate synthase-like protein n=1 Tax=Pseudovirgaria hyperparasitica TaxID=470096 RepID=A0A6A6WCG0_9PEZI|nr:Clavaminate synthase-like protein [Pseudovirgaria hyperparasitica]KAF2759536.1 Clavaminate synthase-like protein [Pseudovirgaria hyperparasitica]
MPGLISSELAVQDSPSPQTGTFSDDLFSKAKAILDIIYRYRCPLSSNVEDRSDEGALTFLSIIYRYIKHNKPIALALPAFPFKSPNSESKVLGVLPDKGEELALAHLNGMCDAIADIHEPGAKLSIVSDGLVYNDLLGVPDKTVWSYGQHLRAIAASRGYTNIEFARLKDLLGMDILEEDMDEMSYQATASSVRLALMNKFGRPAWENLKPESLKEDENRLLTYCGYLKFLQTDLATQHVVGENLSKSRYKKGIEKIAKAMLRRGEAFAKAVRENFPQHIRLSIHPSTGEDKISINTLPLTTTTVTPWHTCIAINVDGSIRAGPRHSFEQDPDLELVEEAGHLSHFRQKSPLYDWGTAKVVFEHQYPCGLIIRPTTGAKLSMQDVPGLKLRKLAEQNSPVIVRGFNGTRNRDLFVDKASEIGKPQKWKFGLVLEVKDKGSESGGLNNVLSQEWMPFHFDGLFKTEKVEEPDGTLRVVPQPPKFQFFTAVTPSPKNTGFTLFSASRLLFQNLPAEISLEQLERLTWSVSTKSFDQTVMQGLKLVTRHPETGLPCLQYHERWPQEKTRFDPTIVTIDNGPQSTCDILESLLHDRRVCYRHSWQQGDLLISDNVGMMHTRSSFKSGADRELWRIHVD